MRIYLDTIGCRLNQAEIEQYARQFQILGHTLTTDPEAADLVVVNTCAVTAAADADSRQKIRQLGQVAPGRLVATGCWATLHPDEAAVLPGVLCLVPNQIKDHLVQDVLSEAPPGFDLDPVEHLPLPAVRRRTRAFIKVQDGCNNHCTFCVTTVARGPGRSRPVEAVLEEVRAALREELDENGRSFAAQEIVLTGVHLGSWGQDFRPPQRLQDLVHRLLSETEKNSGSPTPRLRLSSLEPWDLQADFFSLWENPRLCRHLHLPLQSGCAATLRRMARKTTPGNYADLVASARAAVPGVAITTDLIVGFPGENEAEFEESLDFVRAMGFSDGHIFTYSTRPGTAAAHFHQQVPQVVRKERRQRMLTVLEETAQAYRARFLDQTLPVLWEGRAILDVHGWEMNGLTDNYLRVTAHSPSHLWNQLTPVRLTRQTPHGMSGQIVTADWQSAVEI